IAALSAATFFFYLRIEHKGRRASRIALAISRSALLALLLLTLADPVLQLAVVNRRQPRALLVFDGTDSMAIEDELPPLNRTAIERAVAWSGPPSAARPSRMDYLRALLRKKDANLLARLANEKGFQLEAFLFDGNATSQLRKLQLSPRGDERLDPD